MYKNAPQRFCILDIPADGGEYSIIFRDVNHFAKVVRGLAAQKYSFFQLDDRGRARLIKNPRI